MIAITFKEANAIFKPPPGVDESQCASMPVCKAKLEGGNMDGATIIVAAWLPSPQDIQNLIAGNPVYIGFCESMPPHFLDTKFPLTLK